MISLKKSFIKDKNGDVIKQDDDPLNTFSQHETEVLEDKIEQLEKDLTVVKEKYHAKIQAYEMAMLKIQSLESELEQKHLVKNETSIILDEVRSKNDIMKAKLSEQEETIKYLESSKRSMDEAVKKLNSALVDTKNRYGKEVSFLKKVHKIEIKSLKKELGSERAGRIRLEKRY